MKFMIYTMPVLTIGMLMVVTGCGGVTRTQVDTSRQGSRNFEPTGPYVQMTGVTHEVDVEDPAFMDAVERYMVDQAIGALERHRNYRMLLDPEVALRWSDLDANVSAEEMEHAKPEGFVSVHIVNLEERLGGTVRVGLVSRQRRFARATVRVRLKRAGHPDVVVEGRGRSEVGAWGVVVTVDRDHMRQGEGIWAVDESMVGLACRAALEDAVGKLPLTW